MFSFALRGRIKRHAALQIARSIAVSVVMRHAVQVLPCRFEPSGNTFGVALEGIGLQDGSRCGGVPGVLCGTTCRTRQGLSVMYGMAGSSGGVVDSASWI